MNKRKLKLTGIAGAVALALTGCGGSDGPANLAPTAQAVTIDKVRNWLPVQGNFVVADANGDQLKISAITENGSAVSPVQGIYTLQNGLLTVTGTTFSYLPLKDAATTFSYTVSDARLSATSTVALALPDSDPLAYQQWHLRNTGQKAYSQNSAAIRAFLIEDQKYTEAQADAWLVANVPENASVPGEDMNVAAAYAQGVTGEGSIAVVVDSGLELEHEDLAANILPNRSLNMINGAINVTDPTSTAALGDHGTSVAGLIAAAGWNGMGGRGVAPEAKLIGMNFIQAQTDLNNAIGHGVPGSGISPSDPIAVFNRSYGLSYPALQSVDEISEGLQKYSVTVLRNGLGALTTKSSGNSFRNAGVTWAGSVCEEAKELGLTCLNSNFEPSQTTPYYISVGAVNADGTHTSYSTAGANLFVSAPAGEYGDLEPAMVTTDQMTCLRGYSSFPYIQAGSSPAADRALTPFIYPGHAENQNCNYTSTFNGTSSAAPNAAGVVALILSANPNLSYREIKDILVKTSTKVDPDNQTVVISHKPTDPNPVPSPAIYWQENFNSNELGGGWTLIDGNNDSFNWQVLQELDGPNFTPVGTPYLSSASFTTYLNIGPMNPDNWAITPPINIQGVRPGEVLELSWDVNIGIFTPVPNNENYAVYVSNDPVTSLMEMSEPVYTARNAVNGKITVDLTEYAEQTIFIGFRHFDVKEDVQVTFDSSIGIDNIKVATRPISVTGNKSGQATESENTAGTYTAHAGWVKNAAGFAFNNLYGFGRVNAGEAVKMAKSYTTPMPAEIQTEWINAGTQADESSLSLAIPDNDFNGIVHTIEVNDDVTIESARFAFDVANTELTSWSWPNQTTAGIDLALEVTSPSGTKSILLSSKQAISDPALDFTKGGSQQGYIMSNTVMLSNAFYGENAKGTWTVRLVDTNGADIPVIDSMWPRGYRNNTENSVLEGWGIQVTGH